MGIFDRFFRKDPAEALARAEELLTSGRAYDALVAVQRADERAGRLDPAEAPAIRTRARELEVRAREVLVGSALTEADRAEAEEAYDDATDWIGAALEHAVRADELTAADRPPGDDGRVADLRRRRADLRRRGREAARQPSLVRRFEEGERPGPDPLDTEGTFGTLVGTLDEDVADLYLHRPLPFQRAYIDLNEGRFEAALAGFDGLAAEHPDDAVIRFERGRARLLSGDAAGAREDFEAAWEELGDHPLDPSGELSVPLLWAHATVEVGEPEAAAERLEPLAEPGTGEPHLVAMRAHVLRQRGTPEALAEARELLEAAVAAQGGVLLQRLLAEVHLAEGEREAAVARLEAVVAPACSSGRCDSGRLDVEAARLLTGLHLERAAESLDAGGEPALERPAEILGALAMTLGDLSASPDRALVERYRRLTGTDEVPFPGAVEPEGLDEVDEVDEPGDVLG